MRVMPFSEKQMRVLCWWGRKSPYRSRSAIICDGAVRSGKTVCMGLSFFLWAMSRFTETGFAVCGKTIRSVRRNVIAELLPELKRLGFTVQARFSENRLTLQYKGRENRFYLFGGKDESSAALIQGMTLGGILEGTGRPDYTKCVAISTQAALKEMILPGLLAIIVPLVVGLIPFLGAEALGGLLAGSLVSGFLLAVMMANAGGAWDNAKKYIEQGHFGGKGSDAHAAAVNGDTVGDPFKDTSGPSLNILMKLMTIVALVFAPMFL